MSFCGYGMRGGAVHFSLCGYMACNGQRQNEACQKRKLQKSGWVNAAF